MPHADPAFAAGKAYIAGCADSSLTPDERELFAAHPPWGLILFARNCKSKQQITDLVDDFRGVVGRQDAPVLIDQEGGRVQRLRPPIWPSYPPGRVFGRLAESDIESGRRAAWLSARLIAADLHELGINVDCLPLLDVIVPGASEVIGDRSFGADPVIVADLGRSVSEGLLDGGVMPVVKHVPGHGRATSDSHLTLPVVETGLDDLVANDFAPFAALADMPCAMTGHVVYAAIDASRPATTSSMVIRDIIRGRINFDGLLMSDDVSMKALSGDYADRSRAIYAAGCDLVLHCNGQIEEMRDVALAAPALAGLPGERAARALSWLRDPKPFDRKAGREELLALSARAGWMRTS